MQWTAKKEEVNTKKVCGDFELEEVKVNEKTKLYLSNPKAFLAAVVSGWGETIPECIDSMIESAKKSISIHQAMIQELEKMKQEEDGDK